MYSHTLHISLLALLLAFPVEFASANGVNNNGAGGRGRALNGATVAQPTDAIDAMATNPAGLADLDASWNVGLIGIHADGHYSKRGSGTVDLDNRFGLAPEIALALPFGESLMIGLAVIPEQIRVVDWRYRDSPGGLDGGTSYGFRDHRAEFIAIRSSLGIGAKLNEKLQIGASVGAVYDQTRLVAPYIFQSHPKLKGVKAATDLDTEGIAFNGDLGLIYKASDDLQFGLRYRTKTEIDSKGDATGDAGAQFRSLGVGADGGFHYDAEVETALPRSIASGFSWKATEKLRVLGGAEWVNWSDSFDELTVKLSNGTNSTINGLADGEDVVDYVPLDWDDRFVYWFGVEYEVRENLFLRAGYSYGKNPLPTENITPLNAAISEHTLSAGLGFMLGRAAIDLSYQYDLQASVDVGRSNILDGEYSESSVEIQAHWFGISASVPF
jgi:long-chain fatty acid transport protein